MENDFWIKWMEADEIGKLKLIKTLPVEYPTLTNSYLVDLYETIRCVGFKEEE